MITVPVFDSFNNNVQIGTLAIDETKLPALPGFCFSLGIRANSLPIQPGHWQLVSIAPMDDAAYLQFLSDEQSGWARYLDSTREARG